jgi:very-short-patch-repair endonuclease
MRESDMEDGYPVFTVVSTHAVPVGRPKNLIFASSVKPDLRFRDAVNNDIEIVTNAEKVLVYDRPISVEGLRWRDLQAWWSETKGIDSEDVAKRTLYRRLRDSLPKNSPAQVLLFDAFHHGFSNTVPSLPALLPEVWLHWDPKMVRERGADALLRFRMDFLLLLPHGVRIVLEVDGKHHYARDNGQADSARYAATVAADRDLKLAGYEVFRFGTEELQGEAARGLVKKFFDTLFKRYGVFVPQK